MRELEGRYLSKCHSIWSSTLPRTSRTSARISFKVSRTLFPPLGLNSFCIEVTCAFTIHSKPPITAVMTAVAALTSATISLVLIRYSLYYFRLRGRPLRPYPDNQHLWKQMFLYLHPHCLFHRHPRRRKLHSFHYCWL